MTLVLNGSIFNAYEKKYDNGQKFEIFSLIDPVYYEGNAGKADLILSLNLSGVLRLLDVESDNYRRSGGALFTDYERGILAVADKEENLEKARKYLDSVPYSPIKGKKKMTPAK